MNMQSDFIFLPNVELYHGVKRGARNGIDTSDWLVVIFQVGEIEAAALSRHGQRYPSRRGYRFFL